MELLKVSQKYHQSRQEASKPYVHSFNVTLVRPNRSHSRSIVLYPGSAATRLLPQQFEASILCEIAERFPEVERYRELQLYCFDEDGNRRNLLQKEGDVVDYLTEMIRRNDVGHLYVEGIMDTALHWRHVVGAVAIIGLFGGIKSFVQSFEL